MRAYGSMDAYRGGEEGGCLMLAIHFVHGLLASFSRRSDFGKYASMSVVSLESFLFVSVSVCVSKGNARFD